MKLEDVSRSELLYTSPGGDVKVFRGEVTALQLPVAIKEQSFDTVEASNLAVGEALIQKSLTHPNICKLYNVFLISRDSRVVVISILEWMGKGNLLQYIEIRRSEHRPFTESEVLGYMRTLTEVFALAQEHNICHRDIKPQNIFRTDTGQLKVGDFGSSKQLLPSTFESSLTGSPYFLSPILKQHFLENCSGTDYPPVRHDPFKSDMYSLGLTLLFVAKLVPSESLTRLQNLGTATEREVESLTYSSSTKQLLKLMLSPSEPARPDFLTFRTHLEAMVQPTPELHELFASGKPVFARVSLPLVCIVCQRIYTLDVTHGCSNIMDLYFCGENCYEVYHHPKEAESCERCGGKLQDGNCTKRCGEVATRRREYEESKRFLERERRCYLCGSLLAPTETGECAKCHAKELRKWTVPLKHQYECLFCHGRWQKVGKLSGLFRRKNGEAIKLKCKHRLCSRACFEKLVAARRECPVCLKPIDRKFLKFMQVK